MSDKEKAAETAEEKRELTPEEIKEREEMMKKQKKDLTAFYKGETPLLELQATYEEAITRIEVAKMTRIEIMVAKAQMMAPPPEGDQPSAQHHDRPANSPAESKERTLKKEE